MKTASIHYGFFSLAAIPVTACREANGTQDNATSHTSCAPEAVGKWVYGTFSPTSFWSTSNQQGVASEHSIALDLRPDGTYEMYITHATTTYSCRTALCTYLKGFVEINAAEQSFTLMATQGNYRSLHSCSPLNDQSREARPDELAEQNGRMYFYAHERDRHGRPALRIFFGTEDEEGTLFEAGNWWEPRWQRATC